MDDNTSTSRPPGGNEDAVEDEGGVAWWKNKKLLASLAAAVVLSGVALVIFLMVRTDTKEKPEPQKDPATTTTITTTTTTPVYPLTGKRVADDIDPSRAVVAGKIDAAQQAEPQTGLNQADIIIEEKVEGINRYMGLWQSQDVTEIGPVRSARTGDLPILGMFSVPLFAFSGGNQGVLQAVKDTSWLDDVSDGKTPDSYRRDTERRAPHNLYANMKDLRRDNTDISGKPAQLFSYRNPGEPPAGVTVSSVQATVNVDVSFVWANNQWQRFIEGRAQTDSTGSQLAVDNVLVLETEYVTSPADRQSPQAVTTGQGQADVFVQGRHVQGTWTRNGVFDPWYLVDGQGQEVKLTPGTTWIVLSDRPITTTP